jgi:serine/threonine protein kinase
LVGENYTGKISDLGLSRTVAGVTASLGNYTNSSVGAVKWMSPESIHSGTYSEKTDAYSFGVPHATHDTTRHDTTRHDTTRHDTTRHDTH